MSVINIYILKPSLNNKYFYVKTQNNYMIYLVEINL